MRQRRNEKQWMQKKKHLVCVREKNPIAQMIFKAN